MRNRLSSLGTVNLPIVNFDPSTGRTNSSELNRSVFADRTKGSNRLP